MVLFGDKSNVEAFVTYYIAGFDLQKPLHSAIGSGNEN